MVNKVLVALSVVVVVSALGIGVLVGTQLAGDSNSTPIAGTNGDDTQTPTSPMSTATERTQGTER